MGTVGNSLISGIDPGTIMEAFDALYAYELTTANWLGDRRSLAAHRPSCLPPGQGAGRARRCESGTMLAHWPSAAQLGGSVTADPSGFVARSPLEAFGLPASTNDPSAIIAYALSQVQRAIRAYGELLAAVAGRDEITHHLVRHILRDHVVLEDEMESALAGNVSPAARAA